MAFLLMADYADKYSKKPKIDNITNAIKSKAIQSKPLLSDLTGLFSAFLSILKIRFNPQIKL
jgi:hypothetical protein